MNRVLREKRILSNVHRDFRIDIGPQEIALDYAYKSKGQSTKLIKTFSFDFTPIGSKKAPVLAKEWAWNFSKIKNNFLSIQEKFNNTNSFEIITMVFVKRKDNKNINTALSILREESRSVIQAEDQKSIEQFADNISMI
jgi:hypothetical protein